MTAVNKPLSLMVTVNEYPIALESALKAVFPQESFPHELVRVIFEHLIPQIYFRLKEFSSLSASLVYPISAHFISRQNNTAFFADFEDDKKFLMVDITTGKSTLLKVVDENEEGALNIANVAACEHDKVYTAYPFASTELTTWIINEQEGTLSFSATRTIRGHDSKDSVISINILPESSLSVLYQSGLRLDIQGEKITRHQETAVVAKENVQQSCWSLGIITEKKEWIDEMILKNDEDKPLVTLKANSTLSHFDEFNSCILIQTGLDGLYFLDLNSPTGTRLQVSSSTVILNRVKMFFRKLGPLVKEKK